MVDGRIASRIQEEMEKSAELDAKDDRGLVGAITKATPPHVQPADINRINLLSVAITNNPESTSTAAPPSSQSPRMLILSVSPDASTSYIPLMNSIFAAQKLKVKIDVCKVFGTDTVFFQQAAYLTGGSYLVLERRDALLQYLSMCFLPPVSLRKTLATPSQDKVDFRAACFCHKKVVDDVMLDLRVGYSPPSSIALSPDLCYHH
ncbi:RNA polymerase II transcription factor B subunit 4 [Tulasnella sp. 425]|nr:RNA polymerase II transcription factor B subunit 4 [Tulasnella sp. 425]